MATVTAPFAPDLDLAFEALGSFADLPFDAPFAAEEEEAEAAPIAEVTAVPTAPATALAMAAIVFAAGALPTEADLGTACRLLFAAGPVLVVLLFKFCVSIAGAMSGGSAIVGSAATVTGIPGGTKGLPPIGLTFGFAWVPE